MAYIEGFVAAVPAVNKAAYLRHATESAALFKSFGATRIVEAWGDDVPEGTQTDFRRAVNAKPDEVIVLSWHEYASKEAAESAFQSMMSDPRMKPLMDAMPFDGQRMIYGGFSVIADERQGGAPGYIDGSLLAVPAAHYGAYLDTVSRQTAVILEHGATRIVDAWGDAVPEGQVTDFKRAVQATAVEKVVFSWVEWPSKAARDQGWRGVFTDSRMHAENTPYDEQRRVHGGFVPIVDC